MHRETNHRLRQKLMRTLEEQTRTGFVWCFHGKLRESCLRVSYDINFINRVIINVDNIYATVFL